MKLSPLSAAARLVGRGRILLHSGRDDDGLGHRSYAAVEPSATLIARGHSIVELDATGRPARRFTGDPLEAAEAFLAAHGCSLGPTGDREPRVVGFLSYDLARVIETLPGGPDVGRDTPDLWLGAYGAFARWRGNDELDVIGDDPAARARLTAMLEQPARPSLPPSFGPLVADDDGDHHMARVDKIRDYLAAGDVYQVNLARRHVARVVAPGDALAVYAALCEVAPAPYGALIEADGLTLVSGSPERFLGLVGDRIETRPIKGTRPRIAGGAEELAASPKDAAEHLMIVDLERNDLGRIAETGSVSVDDLGYVVELPGLYHKVSRVSARLRPDVGYAKLLRATFPGGSITGAPKVRAMQLIDELEPARRGPYCGAFGYFGPGALELAIAIRVGVVVNHELRVHVGGGIVSDSDAAAELAETETKAAGWVATLAALAALRAEPSSRGS
ncbi:MAG TPA: anthranilate synthase component I family protein [Kofleriaceae bacterium]|nr:anthranilate synthase component I family protein [Kofleriaceae bacterium]